MRNLLITGAFIAFSSGSVLAADSYTIDSSHTYPNFTISHLGFSTTHGRFDKTTGKLTMDMAKGTGSVDITIDANSINTGFEKRDKHLRSNDFLNAAEFPDITYKSTKVTINGDKATVEGNLTIMGTSKPVTLNVGKIKCGVHPFNKKNVCGFDATASIMRSDFGIKYGLPAVGDHMDLSLQVEAVKD